MKKRAWKSLAMALEDAYGAVLRRERDLRVRVDRTRDALLAEAEKARSAGLDDEARRLEEIASGA